MRPEQAQLVLVLGEGADGWPALPAPVPAQAALLSSSPPAASATAAGAGVSWAEGHQGCHTGACVTCPWTPG